jgi:hypothetical protein
MSGVRPGDEQPSDEWADHWYALQAERLIESIGVRTPTGVMPAWVKRSDGGYVPNPDLPPESEREYVSLDEPHGE